MTKVAFILSFLLLLQAGQILAADYADITDPDYFFYDYSARDTEVVDYQMYSLPGVDVWKFRGPQPDLADGNYFTVLGAAATMGVLVERPYPELVGEKLGMTALNLGIGGASATAYAEDKAIIDHINGGKFLILQVMGAKMEENSRFTLTKQLGFLRRTDTREIVTVQEAWMSVVKTEPWRLFRYIRESRESWVRGYKALLQKVDVPVILFWFSPNEPSYFASLNTPALVDKKSLNKVRSLCGQTELCEQYVEVLSERNIDFEYVSRHSGKPAEIDFRKIGTGETDLQLYRNTDTPYASPEMHEDAVRPLLKAIEKLDI